MAGKYTLAQSLSLTLLMVVSACAISQSPTTSGPPTIAPIQPTATLIPATPGPTVFPTSLPHPVDSVYQFMVFDSESDRAIYIGAGNQETWAYDVEANAWKRMQSKPFFFPADAIYDSYADRLMVFDEGGNTWAFDYNSNTWTDLESANTPSGRWLARMAYDSESDKTILFGGIDQANTSLSTGQFHPVFFNPVDLTLNTNFTNFDETWAFDYKTNSWTKMNSTTRPPGLSSQSMAYDSESDRIIMWSGLRDPLAVVWAYDYNSDTWEESPYSDRPLPGPFGAMAYDSDLDRVFIYLYDQFYSYDYNHRQWEEPTGDLLPGSRLGAAMIYSATAHRLVLYGGATDKARNLGTYLYPPSLNPAQMSRMNDVLLYDSKQNVWAEAASYYSP